MTDARLEWISKRAYTLWEQDGRPHGRDADHWDQAVREREEFEKSVLAADDKPTAAKKPLIEISQTAQTKKPAAEKAKKKAAAPVEKPAAAKAVAKAKSAKSVANGKPA